MSSNKIHGPYTLGFVYTAEEMRHNLSDNTGNSKWIAIDAANHGMICSVVLQMEDEEAPKPHLMDFAKHLVARLNAAPENPPAIPKDYAAWRITFQSPESAARYAYADAARTHQRNEALAKENEELKARLWVSRKSAAFTNSHKDGY